MGFSGDPGRLLLARHHVGGNVERYLIQNNAQATEKIEIVRYFSIMLKSLERSLFCLFVVPVLMINKDGHQQRDDTCKVCWFQRWCKIVLPYPLNRE